MIDTFSVSIWSLLSLLGITILVAAGILALSRVMRFIPTTWRFRPAMVALLALAELLLVTLWLFVLLQHLFGKSPLFEAVALVGMVFFGLWLGSEAFRDILNGVIVRTGGNLRPGDRVCIDGIEGNLLELGTRVMVLESDNGEELLVPYTRVARSTLVREPLTFAAHRHTFALPPHSDVEAIRRFALTCHWANSARQPLISRRGEKLDVTVFAIDPLRGGDIEAWVRARI